MNEHAKRETKARTKSPGDCRISAAFGPSARNTGRFSSPAAAHRVAVAASYAGARPRRAHATLNSGEDTRPAQAKGTAGTGKHGLTRSRTLELSESERQRILYEQQLHPCECLGLWAARCVGESLLHPREDHICAREQASVRA